MTGTDVQEALAVITGAIADCDAREQQLVVELEQVRARRAAILAVLNGHTTVPIPPPPEPVVLPGTPAELATVPRGAYTKIPRETIRDWVQSQGRVTVATFVEQFHCSDAGARLHLARLVESGMVRKTARPGEATVWMFVKPERDPSTPTVRSIVTTGNDEGALPVAGTGKQERTARKDLDSMLRRFAGQIVWERNGAGHITVTCLATGQTTTLASTPRRNGAANAFAKLRAIGVQT